MSLEKQIFWPHSEIKESFSGVRWLIRSIKAKDVPKHLANEIWSRRGELGKFWNFKKEGDEWIISHASKVVEKAKVPPALRKVDVDVSCFDDCIGIPDPTLAKLRDFQREWANHLFGVLKRHGSYIDASEMGTGKSYVTAAIAKAARMSPVIFCPKAVVPSWKKVCAYMEVSPLMVVNYELARMGNVQGINREDFEQKKRKKIVITFDNALFDPDKHLIVFDESHKMKNASSLNYKLAKAALDGGFKIASLSGTPACKPVEFKLGAVLSGLCNEQSFYGWATNVGWQRYSGKDADQELIQRKMNEINSKIFPAHGYRLKKKDVPGFPECDLHAESFDIGDIETHKIIDAYGQARQKVQDINGTDLTTQQKKISASAAFSEARKTAEIAKIPFIKEMANDAVESGQSVVIFTSFRDTLAMFADALKTECIVQGGMNDKIRQRNIENFQADRTRIILVNLQAGGTGLNLHDLNGNHPRLALVCPSDSPFDLLQGLGRVHRDGALTKSNQILCFASGTIEEKICDRVKMKLGNMSLLTDNDLNPALW